MDVGDTWPLLGEEMMDISNKKSLTKGGVLINSDECQIKKVKPLRGFYQLDMPTLTGSKAMDQAVAGFVAGAVTTLLLHPLDLIKTRFQGPYHLSWDTYIH